MTKTVDTVVSYPTVTFDTTVLQTAFVTVYVAQNATTTSSIQPTESACSTCHTSSSSTIESKSLPSSSGLPSIVTYDPTTASLSSTSSISTNQPLATQANSTGPSNSGAQQSQKHAIVSGLSGSIAGVVFIGLFVCLYLRYRRKRNDADDSSLNEKCIRPKLARNWTSLTGATSILKERALTTPSESSVSVDEDHHIIRMNTRHWPRPFAFGEGYRDSVPPGQLRVTNPDSSRPSTSNKRSSDISSRFLNRQRSPFTGAFVGSNRSSASIQSPPRAHGIPTIRIERAQSPQSVVISTVAPSLKSSMSVKTLPIVKQKPPEDPFLVPPSESNRSPGWRIPPSNQSIKSKTSSKAPLQTVAGAVGRTLGHLSSLLGPFHSQPTHTSGSVTNVRALSHFSASTLSSRLSRRSDPFDLDRASLSIPGRAASEFTRYNRTGNWILYEGT